MIQPMELRLSLPVSLANGALATTTQVWNVLHAAYKGDLNQLMLFESECAELIYAQYNYSPPIHFAVREGHSELVKYLLEKGAYDPNYKIYPFLDSLPTIASDRQYWEILNLLSDYQAQPEHWKYHGDNGEIHYDRTTIQLQFEKAVEQEDIATTHDLLKNHPDLATDQTFFWSEGILLFACKKNNREMIDLLFSYGARVPDVLKWTQYYYFERLDGATYMMGKGMNPNTTSWQHVRLLHDMAQKGETAKAELLLKYGADLNPIDEEYQSTPLGMAVRWNHVDMVEFLLKKGADPNKSGAAWSTPLAWARLRELEQVERLLFNAGAR